MAAAPFHFNGFHDALVGSSPHIWLERMIVRVVVWLRVSAYVRVRQERRRRSRDQNMIDYCPARTRVRTHTYTPWHTGD